MKLVGIKAPIIIAVVLLAALLPFLDSTGSARAQKPRTNGVTVVLVVDDSGSMQETDPLQRRGLGGKLFIERLFPDDQIATVLFSSNARVASSLSPVESDDNRDQLKSSFQLLRSSGGSDMRSALAAAFAQLEQDSTDNAKGVVFLTDGQLLESESGSQEYVSSFNELLRTYRTNEWPVFPISFGKDVDTKFLGNVAEVTGGTTCDALSDSELIACFQTVLDTFKETERVLDVAPRCLETGEVVDHQLYVDPFARQLSVVLAKEDLTGQALVLDPSGSSANKPREEGNYLFYNLEDPDTGTWLVRLIGPGCLGRSVAYIQSDVRVDLASPGVVHAAHEPMEFQVELQGRRARGGSWESLKSDMALSVDSPENLQAAVELGQPQFRHQGQYNATGGLGDYRLNFEATAEFKDNATGLMQQRTYIRQKRVEVVKAPEVEVTVDRGEAHRILPGDNFTINGRITSPQDLGLTQLGATFSGKDVHLELAPTGAFWGEVVPTQAGEQTLDVSLRTTLIGRYGEVLYPTNKSARIEIEFIPVVLELTGDGLVNGVDPGKPVALVGRVLSQSRELAIDQSRVTAVLNTPGRSTITVDLYQEANTGNYRGSFIPGASGSYTFASVKSGLTRNGVPISVGPNRPLEISVKSVLAADVASLDLGELYPGEIFTRRLLVSNRADRSVTLTPSSDSADFSYVLSPNVIPAGTESFPVDVQFTVSPQTAFTGALAQDSLSLETSPEQGWVAAIVIPMTYRIGDYFVAFQSEYNLGYIPGDRPEVPVDLPFNFNSPVPVQVEATFTDATGQTVTYLSDVAPARLLVSGAGGETVKLLLPLPANTAPGKYRGEVNIISDPPIPVRPSRAVAFNYRLPTQLERWVLDNWWWAMSAAGATLLLVLSVWGGTVTQRLTIQGRLLIYDRMGMARTRREDLRRFARAEVILGRRGDVTLPDSRGLIDGEHAQIVAMKDSSFPRVYPMGAARVIGPFGEDVDSAGVPLGEGDTFSIGNYNLEWSPAGSTARIARLLGDPWWKWGFLLSVGAIVGLAVGFYVVLL